MNIFREMLAHLKSFTGSFWVVIAATLINQIGNMAVVFLVVYMTQSLSFSLVDGALAFSVLAGSMLLSGIVAGVLVDQIGALKIALFSVLMNGIILLSISITHNYYSILILCALWGICWGMYRPAIQTLVSYLSKPGLHKITFSVHRLALNLGMSIGPVIGGYLAVHSFALIFVVDGVSNIIAFVILIIGLSRSQWMSFRPAAGQSKLLTFSILRSDTALKIFLIGMIPVFIVFFQHETTLPVYLKQNLGLPLSFYGWLFTVNTLLIVFLELVLNVATLNWPYRVNFILGTTLIAVGFMGFYFATSAWHIVLLTAIWTIGEMIFFPSSSSYIADIAPEERRGSYIALYGTCANLSMFMAAPFGALVMQQLGSHALWLTCGIWGAISIGVFSYLREPLRK